MRTSALISSGVALVLPLVLAVAAEQPAQACSCIPPNLAVTYNNSSDVFRGTVLFKIPSGQTVFYVARVHTTYKGCLQPGALTVLATAAQSATCGISVPTGVDHLFTANQDALGLMRIGLCGFSRQFGSLAASHLEFLDSRYNCCGKSCACVNAPLVSCFVDPCRVASCPEGTCKANYCGGCRAEFATNDGAPVCTACRSNSDCPFGQSCSGGQCLPTF